MNTPPSPSQSPSMLRKKDKKSITKEERGKRRKEWIKQKEDA